MKTFNKATLLSAALMFVGGAAQAAEITFTCSQNGNECELLKELAAPWESKSGHTLKVDLVPYDTILKSLPLQFAAGEGPDLAQITDMGGLAKYMLDLTQYVDASYWEKNFSNTLAWTRVNGPGDKGIYNLMTQLTATGPYINKTLFDQAGVAVPGAGASWEDWADVANKVAKATGVPFPMAMDRSGHRFAGPAISYGAKYFKADGDPITVDDGFGDFAKLFVKWNQDGTMAKEVWAGSGGSSYQDASNEFINGQLVFYMSGSWQIGRFNRDIGDAFDWQSVPLPCGAGGCTGIPGGAAIMGNKNSKNPEAVASLIDFFAQPDNMQKIAAGSGQLTGHQGLQESGVDYSSLSPAAQAAMAGFSGNLTKFTPTAFAFQGYKNNRAIMNSTVDRLTSAIVGETSVEEALASINRDVAEAVAAAN